VKYLPLQKRVTDNSQHGLHFEGCFVHLNTFFWEAVRRFHQALKVVHDTKKVKTLCSSKNSVRCYHNVHWSPCKVPVILVRFLWNFNFLDRFSKKSSNVKFHTNPLNGSPLVPYWQMDGMTKLILAFRNLANEPKNDNLHIHKLLQTSLKLFMLLFNND
jgi:hypothetical protein